MKRMYRMLMVTLMLFSAAACEMEDDGLPDASQNGAEIMAAKINGRNWVHNGGGGVMGGGGINAVYGSVSKFLGVSGNRYDDFYNNSVGFSLTNVDHVGDYELREEASKSYGEVFDYKDRNNTKAHKTTGAKIGRVTITKLDTVNKIISGTFSFRAYLEGSTTEYVEVTEGRFDVKY